MIECLTTGGKLYCYGHGAHLGDPDAVTLPEVHSGARTYRKIEARLFQGTDRIRTVSDGDPNGTGLFQGEEWWGKLAPRLQNKIHHTIEKLVSNQLLVIPVEEVYR